MTVVAGLIPGGSSFDSPNFVQALKRFKLVSSIQMSAQVNGFRLTFRSATDLGTLTFSIL